MLAMQAWLGLGCPLHQGHTSRALPRPGHKAPATHPTTALAPLYQSWEGSAQTTVTEAQQAQQVAWGQEYQAVGPCTG